MEQPALRWATTLTVSHQCWQPRVDPRFEDWVDDRQFWERKIRSPATGLPSLSAIRLFGAAVCAKRWFATHSVVAQSGSAERRPRTLMVTMLGVWLPSRKRATAATYAYDSNGTELPFRDRRPAQRRRPSIRRTGWSRLATSRTRTRTTGNCSRVTSAVSSPLTSTMNSETWWPQRFRGAIPSTISSTA